MNEIIQAMKERRSCRKYQDTMIPKEDLEEIIEAGLYAASGMGKQSPIIVAVTNKEVRDELSKMNAAVMGSENDPFYGDAGSRRAGNRKLLDPQSKRRI